MSSAWKVAYADFVTAMMAFFLLLWVLNMVPRRPRAGLAAYFSGERNFDSSSTSPVSNNPFIQNTDKIDTRDLKINEVEKSHYAIAQKIKQMLMADAVPQSSSGISADDVGVQLRVNSDVMFKAGSVDFLPEGEKVLGSVLQILKEYNLYLVVRGHADSTEPGRPMPRPGSSPAPEPRRCCTIWPTTASSPPVCAAWPTATRARSSPASTRKAGPSTDGWSFFPPARGDVLQRRVLRKH